MVEWAPICCYCAFTWNSCGFDADGIYVYRQVVVVTVSPVVTASHCALFSWGWKATSGTEFAAAEIALWCLDRCQRAEIPWQGHQHWRKSSFRVCNKLTPWALIVIVVAAQLSTPAWVHVWEWIQVSLLFVCRCCWCRNEIDDGELFAYLLKGESVAPYRLKIYSRFHEPSLKI